MSERKRCHTITYIGRIGGVALRAVCDRPIGHPTSVHRGRLSLGLDVYGIIEWSIAGADR